MIYSRIVELPEEVAGKIAAGEVIERPLSVVKELLENSIDAGATSITVEIGKGGKEYIRVTDNGCGISKDQLSLAFTRHATSKLRTAEDLDFIDTLGFRGEALASIASVSRTELISRPADQKLGARICVESSNVTVLEDAACEEGTTIIVKDLFYSIPARLKFLKPDNTESALITDYVSKMAIAWPQVRIRLISNGSTLFTTPGRNSLKQAIMTVYSPKMCAGLLELAADDGDMTVKGYISSPTYYEKNRRRQVFFVNGRLIKSRLLENAVADAYSDKLFEGMYPAVFIFLTVDPSQLDVNIHPHKTEVRFYQEKAVSDFLIKSIRRTLLDPRGMEARTVLPERTEPAVPVFERPEQRIVFAAAETAPLSDYTVPAADEAERPAFVSVAPDTAYDDFFKDLRIASEEKEQIQEEIFQYNASNRLIFSGLTIIGQFRDTYLILKDPDGLYIMDQHAAHERVMYEKLIRSFNSDISASQQLLVPVIKDIGMSEMQQAESAVDALLELGFDIKPFGPSAFAISAVPGFMDIAEAEDFIDEFFAAAAEGRNVQARKDQIITRSCKSAVKAHDHLSDEEIKALLLDLDRCENPYSCPHGRPTFVKFTEYELERMFRRK
ncbi:MAG: DNA mismatch repair endonuclease MutL [Clostridia bacterium]|nr:DNA mismatch repair endonuclease MutL [Clostridia bacterium]